MRFINHILRPSKTALIRAMASRRSKPMLPPKQLCPEEGIRVSEEYEDWFNTLSPLQQATHLLMEKICALNVGVTDALIGLDSPDALRMVAEDLKLHIERFLSAFNESVKNGR